MAELQKRLTDLFLRLDHMGLRVEQAVVDALRAMRDGSVEAGAAVDRADSVIDREEVEIEQECIRLLALYQPAAVDLRTICAVIKVNNDLERIADKAAGIGRRVKHIVAHRIQLEQFPGLDDLCLAAQDVLSRMIRLLNTADVDAARRVIEMDRHVDDCYKRFVRTVLDRERGRPEGLDVAMTLVLLARSLERIGDLCSNIAEDIVFLRTGDIVRHGGLGENGT